VQELDPRDVGIANAHADRRKIHEEAVDAALEKAQDFGVEISVRCR
jgi:hypothetical protein